MSTLVLVYKNTFLSVQCVPDPPSGFIRSQTSPTSVPSSASSSSSRLSIATEEPDCVKSAEIPVTCMLRNLPNKYDVEAVMAVIDSMGFALAYDFVYLPIDWRNLCNVGYLFCNFRRHEDASRFMAVFTGFRFPSVNSRKICEVCWANVQGLHNNIEHYRNSPILEKYRPLLFDETGRRLPFPQPDPETLQVIRLREAELSARPGSGLQVGGSHSTASSSSKGPETHKIFVGGLAKNSSALNLRSHFSRFAPVRDVAVVADRTSGKSRGFAFVLFDRPVPPQVLSHTHCLDGAVLAVKPYSQASM